MSCCIVESRPLPCGICTEKTCTPCLVRLCRRKCDSSGGKQFHLKQCDTNPISKDGDDLIEQQEGEERIHYRAEFMRNYARTLKKQAAKMLVFYHSYSSTNT